MLSYDDPAVESRDPELQRFREWMECNFPDASLYLHESVHISYHRDVGHDPRIFGPHYIFFEGKWHYAIGSVDSLPEEIAMEANPVLVAKAFLGPALIEEQLWPERKKQIWEDAYGDVYNFNCWISRRYPEIGDVPPQWRHFRVAAVRRKLSDQVRDSVLRDLQQESFRAKLFAVACEYEEKEFSAEINRELPKEEKRRVASKMKIEEKR